MYGFTRGFQQLWHLQNNYDGRALAKSFRRRGVVVVQYRLARWAGFFHPDVQTGGCLMLCVGPQELRKH